VTPPGGAGLVVAIVSPAKDAERWRRRRQRKHVHIAESAAKESMYIRNLNP